MDEDGGSEGLGVALVAKIMGGEAAQFVVDEWREKIESGLVPGLPLGEKSCNLL